MARSSRRRRDPITLIVANNQPLPGGVTTTEQTGLQRAIARAIEKEEKANGTWVDPSLPVTTVTYTARVAYTKKSIVSTDPEAFKTAVRSLQAAFPKLRIYLFETTVTR